jgi:hypothetical protein
VRREFLARPSVPGSEGSPFFAFTYRFVHTSLAETSLLFANLGIVIYELDARACSFHCGCLMGG